MGISALGRTAYLLTLFRVSTAGTLPGARGETGRGVVASPAVARRTIIALRRGGPPVDELDILFEDNHCIAVHKPAGVLSTHYQGTEETLDRQVKAYLK